ncbi:hypothetical protein EV175_000115 [Coemansia sp. RSA 1933]|nr:hypothetical protein EV175_000115 [Coemansia sp. RSA 1933]
MPYLTKELLSTFIGDATTKAQQTLASSSSLTPFVFANSALLWLIPATVNHPLRRAVGLSTAFILVTESAKATRKERIELHSMQSIGCGAEPLERWRSLALQTEDNVQWRYSYDWGSQRLHPLERNKARMLTAQYAQILPQLSRTESTEAPLPMLVFTRDVEAVAMPKCFYLAVFSPSSASAFANVVAIRKADASQGAGVVELLEQQGKGERFRMQCWAEYDLLGSPVPLDQPLHGEDAFNVQTSAMAVPDGADDISMHSAGDESPVATEEPASISRSRQSYVSLHGVWVSEASGNGCKIELPPIPPPATQWILELVLSTPLAQEPDSSRSLWALHMEIQRLEAWSRSWTNGTKWIQCDEQPPFSVHAWQQNKLHTAEDALQQTLDGHREEYGKRLDEFMDTAIYDTAGSTTLGRLGRTRDIHALAGFPVREDLDFTERLWNLVHYAHDDSDLAETIAAVAEGLETKKLQPYIQPGNTTALGKLIRDALQVAHQKTLVDDEAAKEQLAAQLDLWVDERPLDALVPVGVHKLRADFWFYFVGGHLATPRQLAPFIDAAGMAPTRLVPRFWLLLRTLEVWWLVQQAVPAMPQQFVRQTVAAVLAHFELRLDDIDSKAEEDHHVANVELLKLSLYLPMYSSDVQEFATSIADGFPPTRITAAATAAAVDAEINGAVGRAPAHRMLFLTKTPGLFDMQLAGSGEDSTEMMEEDREEDEEYSVFEAKLF